MTSFRYYENSFPFCSGQDGWTLSNDPSWEYASPTVGHYFQNTTTSTTISGIKATYWYSRNNAGWVAVAGSSSCWTLLQRDAALDTTRSGVQMYAYSTTYTCAITPVNGTTTLPGFRFRSACFTNFTSSADRWSRRLVTSTINGQTQSRDTDWFEIIT